MAKTLNNLGNVQRALQKLADAERSYAEALQIRRDLALQEPHIFNQDVATTLSNFGNVQWNLRKLADAERSFTEALQIRRDLALQEPHIFNQDVATTLNSLGAVQRELQKLTDAEESYAEALRLYRDLALQEPHIFNQDAAKTLNNLGTVQRDLQKSADAEKSYVEALQLYRDLALQEPHIFNQFVALTLDNFGTLQSDLGRFAKAERSYAEALQISRDLALREPHIFNREVAKTLNNLGYLQLEQAKLDEARENFETARRLIEDLRAMSVTIDDRNRILQDMNPIYSNLLDCYIRMNDWKKALEIAELGKSRSLSDLLNLKSENLQPKAPTSETLAIVKNLGRKYSDLIKELQQIERYEKYLSEQLSQFENDIKRIKTNTEPGNDPQDISLPQIAEQKQALEEQKRKAQAQRFTEQAELKAVLDEIRHYDQDFPPKAKEVSNEEIIDLAENLNRTIVIFRVLSESTAIIFVFPDRSLRVKTIPNFGEDELAQLFYHDWLLPYQQWKKGKHLPRNLREAFPDFLSSPETEIKDWFFLMEQTLETIYQKLLIYVHQILKEKSQNKKILLIPSQSLALLPLHAASWKDESGKKHYLLEEFTISYCPSVSVFKRCQENEKGRINKTLLVNNPGRDLTFSEREVRSIKKIHQSNTIISGKNATKSAVLKALSDDYGFTHFACHGFYNQENQFDSGLIMADEEIKLSEIINCNLQKNWLTTLSACETGVVDFASPTDEHFGLPLGFIFAGSPSIWASLWLVSDEQTSLLMQKAYEHLSKKAYRNDKPEALRQAQLLILREFSHPYYWAGFQHFGM